MPRAFRNLRIIVSLLVALTVANTMSGQSNEQGQIRGTISDTSGAVIPHAQVTLTNTATNIAHKTTADGHGVYVFTTLPAASYHLLVEAPSFGPVEKDGIQLVVNQQTTIDVTLTVGSAAQNVQVQAVPVLLDSDNATLGADVGEQYLTQVPLENRDPFGLVFLAAGVTETAGSGVQDSYPGETNFVSNGQRNATAEIRIDGALTTSPEQGEGGTSGVYYQATVEALQEVKVQNNSYSAEFGNNGGTIIDEVMKSGSNKLHGSAYEFNQNSIFDARDYFNTGPKPGHSQNQFGATIGGPILKNKTFFFADFEAVLASNPINIVATVPTAAEIAGDFSQAMTYDVNGNPVQNAIYNPASVNAAGERQQYSDNKIPSSQIDPVGQAVLKLYPAPNQSGDPVSGANNFRKVILSTSNQKQFDVKLDHHFNDKSTLTGRYSNVFANGNTPTVFGDSEFNDGLAYTERVFNDGLIYSYTPTSHTLWTITAGLDRVKQPSHTNYPSPTSVGFPSYLEQNGLKRMPSIIMPQAPWTSIYDQCCVDTKFAHTLGNYASNFSWTKGEHTFKFGGEQRIFLNNFFEPNYPNGYFSFAQVVTADSPFSGNTANGNSFAGLLIGWPDSGSINVSQSVADKSEETGFYGQDDWRITSKLTLNLGVRYEWSSPYTARHNNIEFNDYTGSSGIGIGSAVDPTGAVNIAVPAVSNLPGTTIFASNHQRTVTTDRNNVAPRFGFAYLANEKLAIRGGAGVYYGMNVATNYQYPGPAFSASPQAFFTNNSYADGIRLTTLSNPFPKGIEQPQGTKYGPLAEWGLQDDNNLNTGVARNAEIYQWNLGIQQAFPMNIVLGINYSANRSTHLPWGGYNSTSNRNFIPSSIRSQETSSELNEAYTNPFQSLFNGGPLNVPDSRYSGPTLPLLNLQRPYPQFDGAFEGLPRLIADSWYNALQIVFQKRGGKYLNIEGNYTWSKNMDDSSTGFNAFVGTLNSGNPQELDHLKAEWSVSANDATNRVVLAAVLQVPVGRGDMFGANMSRPLNALVGGWQLTTLTTYQSGQPLPVSMSNARLADGNQRPNVTCPNSQSLTTGISIREAGRTGAPYVNSNCFADPGDQQAGNAPRYFSQLRSDTIHDTDLSLERVYKFGERVNQFEVHLDCLNCTNTERFGIPDLGYGNSTFGVINSTAAGTLPRNLQLGARYQF